MEIWKLGAIVLGAGGFWKVLDAIIKYRSERKLKSAETKHLYATTQQNIVANWVQWSQKLEERVKESEKQALEMEAIFERQRKRIRSLEEKVELMEHENKELRKQLSELRTTEHKEV